MSEFFKKVAFGALCVALSACTLSGCGDGLESSSLPKPEPKGTIVPTVYNVEEIVDADETEAGSIDAWTKEVFTSMGGNNDEPTKNAVIHCPYYTLNINGTEVPVYTARAGEGPHSFAWIDVTDNKRDFVLEVKLTTVAEYGKCVVLPESKGGTAEISGKEITAYITEFGSYSFTFNEKANDEVTDPTMEPLTIMVTEEVKIEDVTPEGYEEVIIEPGYHEEMDLEFSEEEKVYRFKAGLHEISSIRIPSNSVLYLDRGAYLKVTDRLVNGSYNTQTAIHTEDSVNVRMYGRGLLDCGELQGGAGKYKHVFNATRVTDGIFEGLTIINANTWTMCMYHCDEVEVNRNLLLAYRTFSDGIMMSECCDSSGRYNFVRTGDDGIEYKGTGWGNHRTGSDCIYEYNDVWSDKGTCYGLTWESECDMDGMIFRNNTIGFAQPVWTEGNNALDCRLGTNPNVTWKNILFENIEIYHCISFNIMQCETTGVGANLENVTFRNITVASAEPGVRVFRMVCSPSNCSTSGIILENINFCGKIITPDDKADKTLFYYSTDQFEDVVIK